MHAIRILLSVCNLQLVKYIESVQSCSNLLLVFHSYHSLTLSVFKSTIQAITQIDLWKTYTVLSGNNLIQDSKFMSSLVTDLDFTSLMK